MPRQLERLGPASLLTLYLAGFCPSVNGLETSLLGNVFNDGLCLAVMTFSVMPYLGYKAKVSHTI